MSSLMKLAEMGLDFGLAGINVPGIRLLKECGNYASPGALAVVHLFLCLKPNAEAAVTSMLVLTVQPVTALRDRTCYCTN